MNEGRNMWSKLESQPLRTGMHGVWSLYS